MLQFISANMRNRFRETIDKAAENEEDIDFAVKAKAVFNGFIGLMYWFKDISFRYNTLPQNQKLISEELCLILQLLQVLVLWHVLCMQHLMMTMN